MNLQMLKTKDCKFLKYSFVRFFNENLAGGSAVIVTSSIYYKNEKNNGKTLIFDLLTFWFAVYLKQ
jgi:hypothetical protein